MEIIETGDECVGTPEEADEGTDVLGYETGGR